MNVELNLPAQPTQVVAARHAVESLAESFGLASSAGIVTTELVERAIEHSPAGGVVRLTASIDEARLLIEVRDSGTGPVSGDSALVSSLAHRIGAEQRSDGRFAWAELLTSLEASA